MYKIPESITLCTLDIIVMPNGEIICKGIILGWFENFKEYISIK